MAARLPTCGRMLIFPPLIVAKMGFLFWDMEATCKRQEHFTCQVQASCCIVLAMLIFFNMLSSKSYIFPKNASAR